MNKGFLSILLATSIFGTAGVFVKTLHLPVTVMACLRVLVPTAYFLLRRPDLRRKIVAHPNKRLIVASLLTAIRILLWVLGFLFAAMSKAVVMLYTWPIIFTVLSAVYLNEKVSTRSKLLLATAFCGILIIYSGEEFSFQNRDLIGMLLMLVVAMLNATVMVVFKKELNTHSPQEVVLYDNLIGTIIFLPFLVYHFGHLEMASLGLGLVYGFVIGLLGYVLLYYGLSRVKASLASILSYMEVVSATVFGVVFFNEQLTLSMLIGGGLVLLAAALVRNEQ